MADKPLGQTYHEEVESLKGQGLSNADAIRQVAAKYDKKENAVRGGINQYRNRNQNSGAPRRGRRPAPSVDGLMEDARKSLEDALNLVDREVDEAKAALDAAQQRYGDVVAGVKDKKADIEKKLKALA